MARSVLFGDDVKPVIFGMRKIVGTQITITKTSTVQSIPLSFNMFDDPEFIQRVARSQVDMLVTTGAVPVERSEDLVTAMINNGGIIRDRLTQNIGSSVPINRDVHNGVFVTILTNENLNSGLLAKLQPASSSLDRAILRTTPSGSSSSGFENLYVDQAAGIASFNLSVNLRKVVIAGNETDVRINHVEFLVAGPTRVMFVDLIYLSSDGIGVF